MNRIVPETLLFDLFTRTFDQEPNAIMRLPQSGSARQYFRIVSENHSVIGTYNEDRAENEAFLSYTKHFLSKNIAVPKLFAEDLEKHIYLQEDLGDETLFSRLEHERKGADFPKTMIPVYKKVITKLIEIQTIGGKDLDYSVAYPRAAFDAQSVLWDLNYFKYHFLKLAYVPFNEQSLENDFQRFTEFLAKADSRHFLFRDFQSRNIVLKDDEVYFIDYQGGRRGALQYDLASLLYDSKAEIPENVKVELREFYKSELAKKHLDTADFDKFYPAYVLVRLLQAMGAYGYRGFFEGKAHFLESIEPAVKTLENVLKETDFLEQMPHLKTVLQRVIQSENLKKISDKQKLTVSVKSFSYKRGMPYDATGNGGGFVFDCRFPENPGRVDGIKEFCGKDAPVIEFLEQHGEIQPFLEDIFSLLRPVISKYIIRKHKHLAVWFGCTGGKHRSVYCAEKTADFLQKNFNVKVELKHTEDW